jgi:adenylate cyclase
MLKPLYKQYIKQILPFIVIWFIFGMVYSLLEYGLLGQSLTYPSTGNPYNFKSGLMFIISGSIVMGFVQGFIEVVWLRQRFQSRAFWKKILFKSLFYLALIMAFLISMTILNSMYNFNNGEFNRAVIQDINRFVNNFAFWSVIIYIAVALNFALFFSEISGYLGHTVLYNFLLGRYHNPNKEVRIFMFLDMKSSTTIAETLGHETYFKLLKNYYADMTTAILETDGDIYQYVGDEIVVSWLEKKGLYNNNCISCFQKIETQLNKRKEFYIDAFGLVPSFKAGYHIGEVTTGEIGIIKKDIIYTGDILNTAARIQSECNNYNSRLLASEDLKSKLLHDANLKIKEIGKLKLRGKTEAVNLFDVRFEH